MTYLANIDADHPLPALQAAACTYRIAFGARDPEDLTPCSTGNWPTMCRSAATAYGWVAPIQIRVTLWGRHSHRLRPAAIQTATRLLRATPFVRSRNVNLYGHTSYDAAGLQDRVGTTIIVTDKNIRAANVALSGDVHDSLGGSGITVVRLSYRSGRLDVEAPAARALDDASARGGRIYKVASVNVRVGEEVTLLTPH
jgi:hypothetical protein